MRMQRNFRVLSEQKVFRLSEQKVFRLNGLITIVKGVSVPKCSVFVPALIGSNKIDKGI